MKKLGLISLVLIVACGMLGVGYSAWSQQLNVSGSVSTGSFDVVFQQAVSNDGAGLNDPSNQGSWSWTSGTVTAANWAGTRAANNKGVTTVSGTGAKTLTINMDQTYVGYWSSIGCTLKNTGSIPLKVESVTYTVTPPAGRTASDITVYFSDALVESSHTQIDPLGEKLGAVYVKWNAVPTASATYTLTVTITTSQWNMVP